MLVVGLLVFCGVKCDSWQTARMGGVKMPGKSFEGELPVLTEPQRELAGRLKGHVEMLGGTIGVRTALEFPEKLEAAAKYIEAEFRAMGYEPMGQSYVCRGRPVRNIEAAVERSGSGETVIVVGAHYDSAVGTPGANDNGTGVAAMLELAREAKLKRWRPKREVRFVAFVNEEPPYFGTKEMGSYVYASRCRARDERVIMFSLETMGYYSDEAGSQKYPKPLSEFYPDRGNFIGFATRTEDEGFLRAAVERFRWRTDFPSEGVAMPASTPGIGYSDHWSFWQHGYSALMVTDSAMFRYPYYHTPQDTPEKVDYQRLARVTEGLGRMVEEFAYNR